MRAIPHVLGRFQGRDVEEHYCPGGLTVLDELEAGRKKDER